MAINTTTTMPAEAILADVPHDDRTPLGLPLPHPDNSVRLREVPRLRAAIIMIDALVAGVPAQVQTQVQAALAAFVAGAPALLDTLDEIAAALGDDPNYAATMTTQLGLRATKAELTAAVATLQAAIDAQATLIANQRRLNPVSLYLGGA